MKLNIIIGSIYHSEIVEDIIDKRVSANYIADYFAYIGQYGKAERHSYLYNIDLTINKCTLAAEAF